MTAAPLLSLVLLMFGAAPEPASDLDRIDAAQACARRAQPACTLEWLAPLVDRGDLSPELLRDVLILAGRAHALVDNPEAARSTFRRLRATGSRWRPEPDDDPRIRAAWDASGTTTTPSRPVGPVEPTEPAPLPTAPLPLGNWSLALGAGAAFPVGASADRFDPGMALGFELAFATCLPDPLGSEPAWYAVLRGSFVSLALADTVAAEPSQDRTLGIGAATLGMGLRLRLAPAWHLLAQAGLGLGTFGIGPSDAGLSLAVETSIGARWALDPAFALRIEAAGMWLIPFDHHASDGHPTVSLFAEFAF
jgi:hypothetical protein